MRKQVYSLDLRNATRVEHRAHYIIILFLILNPTERYIIRSWEQNFVSTLKNSLLRKATQMQPNRCCWLSPLFIAREAASVSVSLLFPAKLFHNFIVNNRKNDRKYKVLILLSLKVIVNKEVGVYYLLAYNNGFSLACCYNESRMGRVTFLMKSEMSGASRLDRITPKWCLLMQ